MFFHNYTPLQFCVNISKRFTWFLRVLYIWAIFSCFTNDLSVGLQLGLAVVVLLHFVYLKPFKKTVLTHTETGWQIVEARQMINIDVLPSTVICPFAVFLHFKQDDSFKTLLIMSDALLPEDYRRLIVRLKTSLDYQV